MRNAALFTMTVAMADNEAKDAWTGQKQQPGESCIYCREKKRKKKQPLEAQAAGEQSNGAVH